MKLPEDKVNQLIQDYKEGMLHKELAKKYGVHDNSISGILKRRGIDCSRRKLISEETQQYIIQQYTVALRASPSIAAELQIDGGTVCRILRRHNIVLRPSEDNKRTYLIPQRYFQTIDTEEKAYFLGFLYADGCLSSDTGYCIRLGLHPKDKDVLEKFSTAIYGFIKVSEDSETSASKKFTAENSANSKEYYLYVDIYSKRMWKDLIVQGCPPQKSFTITFPNDTIIPTNLKHHFLRGYFDGDGCLSLASSSHPVVDFSSSKLFIEGLIPYLESQGIKCNKMYLNKENELSANVQLTAFENIQNMLNLLYKDATVYMERKKQLREDFVALYAGKQMSKVAKYLDESKYGTTFIPSWNNIQLNKENIAQFNESQKAQVAQFVFEWFREGGFPHATKTPHELLHEFALLRNTAPNSILGEANENGNLVLKTANQNGAAIFKHFSPHFFEVKEGKNLKRPSMLETFQDDDRLMKVIINRMDQNFQVNGNMLRQGLSNSKIAFKASIFNPMIARYLYSKYTTEGDIIYDYSMGFGQRLTAALSLNHKIKYVGVDVLGKSISSNQAIFSFFQDNIPSFNKEAEIVQAGSEEYCPEQYQGKVKLAFSSPPYFNLEHYSNDKSQAYSDCSYANFINGYWKKTVVNIDKLLLPEGYFLLNIKETIGAFNLAEDMLNVIKGQGFKLLGRYDMQLSRNTAFGGRDDKHKYEPIFVLKRA